MKTSSKIFIGLSGLLFIIAGVMCLASPQATLLSLAWLLGFFTLFSGIATLAFYFGIASDYDGSGFILLSAIADIIMGMLFLGHQMLVAAAIPFVFAAWIMVVGVHTVIQAFEFKKAGFSNWTVLLILGLLTVLFAAGSFIDPAISAISITLLVGVALISRGVNRFVFLAGIGRLL